MQLEVIPKRAKLLHDIRQFFAKRSVLEVDTPHLASTTTTDPQVSSLKTGDNYLQTSPEFFMKRLLAAGSDDIYQLAHVFRDDEKSPRHRKEFMLLEWYRTGFDMFNLMDEVFELVRLFLPSLPKVIVSYQEIFKTHTGIGNVHEAGLDQLKATWQAHKKTTEPADMSKTDWLDLIMVDLIEPKLEDIVFIHSYPIEQAALAKIKNSLAQRFELYINGVEIANGFDELNDTKEQKSRFILENTKRKKMGLETIELDNDFLQALNTLPQCSGVALGVDRVLMLMLNVDDIDTANLF